MLTIVAVLFKKKRKQKNKNLDKELFRTNDKTSEGSLQFGLNGDINTIDSKGLTSSMNEKSYSSPFTDLSNPNLSEMHGTYRSNIAYDNADKSLSFSTTILKPSHKDNGYNTRSSHKALFEHEEYWRTNI